MYIYIYIYTKLYIYNLVIDKGPRNGRACDDDGDDVDEDNGTFPSCYCALLSATAFFWYLLCWWERHRRLQAE